jgi:hypothetical protein
MSKRPEAICGPTGSCASEIRQTSLRSRLANQRYSQISKIRIAHAKKCFDYMTILKTHNTCLSHTFRSDTCPWEKHCCQIKKNRCCCFVYDILEWKKRLRCQSVHDISEGSSQSVHDLAVDSNSPSLVPVPNTHPIDDSAVDLNCELHWWTLTNHIEHERE